MLKRLHWYLSRTDRATTNYRYHTTIDNRPVQKDLYDAECHTVLIGRLDSDRMRGVPTFWLNGIAYTIARTHKLAPDRPTFIISIPVEKLGLDCLTTAAADYCLRTIRPYFEKINAEYANRSRPDRDNGKFYIYDPGPVVLQRNAAYFAEIPAKDYEETKGNSIIVNPDIDHGIHMCLNIRIEVQLPYLKLDRAKTMLCKQMPDAAERFIRGFDYKALANVYKLEKTQQAIRDKLNEGEYCAFIANGSILARQRTISEAGYTGEIAGSKFSNLEATGPMKDALPFQSPPYDEIEIAGVRGMGIRRGVTVITGGGYSGKSTVLNAISAGIYNHVSGDGRELCITHDSAATITAEDGRAVSCLNISPFIKWIPGGDPSLFSTTHASGSTSQAANIMEAVDAGAKLLLIDEDRSATNFMIRDATMKTLIQKEPITPFTDRVRELAEIGTSTILVIGGSGEYLGVADKVYIMDDFVMSDVTDTARGLACSTVPPSADTPAAATLDMTDGVFVAAGSPGDVLPAMVNSSPSENIPNQPSQHTQVSWKARRRMVKNTLSSYPTGSGREKLSISDTGFIILGDERIDIRNLHDIITPAQVNALAFMLRHLAKANEGISGLEQLAMAMRGLKPSQAPGVSPNNKKPTKDATDALCWVKNLYTEIEKDGLNLVNTSFFTTMERFMDLPRPYELMAAIYRMRNVEWVEAANYSERT